MRKNIKTIAIFSFFIALASCNQGNPPRPEKEDITIVYTNDIHGYIANEVEKDGETSIEGLRISHIGGYVDELKKQGKNVLLVDAGDQVQGSIYGAMDRGVDMIEMMNKAGYDLATPGNHDFDFGMDGFNYFVEHANFPYISCNFESLVDKKNVLDSSKIFDFGGVKIGFVGISTPETITSSTPRFFENDDGELIYKFLGYDNPNDLFQVVQKTIDELKGQTDYVIALGHVGVGTASEKIGCTSEQIIQNTSGLAAFIDGHSHTKMESKIIKTKDGKDCVLTQTGCFLASFGEMIITKEGSISTKLIEDVPYINKDVQSLESALIEQVASEMGKKISYLDKELFIAEPDDRSVRLVRRQETNLGNLCSDSMYWYLNEVKQLDCDVSLINGGGIRAGISPGDVTYMEAKAVEPFGDQICLVRIIGSELRNAIEMGAYAVGTWNEAHTIPNEYGGFLHLAGVKYDIDASIPSSVKLDGDGMFVSVEGEYRVKNIQVYDKKAMTYVPLEDDKAYLVSGNNYILTESGNGFSMFGNSEIVADYLDEDFTILAEFMKSFDNGHINNANSPLKGYRDYLYDYENPYGSGRINILNLE